jgi:hypothetical protein
LTHLAVRGIDADIRWNNEGSFHKDELKDLRFDYILANPPFNVSDWGGERLREDVRWKYGAPPVQTPTMRGFSSSGPNCSGDFPKCWANRVTVPKYALIVASERLRNCSSSSIRFRRGVIQ